MEENTYLDEPMEKEEYTKIHNNFKRGMFVRNQLERVFDSPQTKLLAYKFATGEEKDYVEDTHKTMGVSQHPNLLCVFWGQEQQTLSYLLKGDNFKPQMKTWRILAKNKTLQILSCNNIEHQYKNRNYYSFTIQPTNVDSDFGADGTQLLFGFFCSGLSYHWTSKKNRDVVYKYIMNIKD
jgi:hypothetical protein